MENKVTVWIYKRDISCAIKNNGKPSKRDIADDYSEIWFAKASIPDMRGMVEAYLVLKS